MLGILVAATRMKNGAGWAALIIVTTTVPVYLANLARDLGADAYMVCWYIGLVLNTLCMPSLWFFVHSQMDKSFRLTTRSLLHVLPALISLLAQILYYARKSDAEIEADRVFMVAGGENLPAIVNDVIVFGQFFIYSVLSLFYISRRKKYLQDNFSDSDYLEVRWTVRFLITFFALFFIVFVAYVINPRTDTWLIPILNVIGMAYLVYVVVKHSTALYLSRLPDVSNAEEQEHENTPAPAMSDEQMKEICGRVTDYLQSSKAYTNPGLSINMLFIETGIHSRKISTAINGYLHLNFFDLINEMRIEEAKRLLLSLEDNYTVESVYPGCGFRSRSAFFAAFKKFASATPTQWIKDNT